MTVLINNDTSFDIEEYEKLFNDVVLESINFENFESECEISISLVDNCNIQKLNKQFRNIDAPTDVLSFPMLNFEKDEKPEKNENGEIILGDIVISIDKAINQANEYGHTLRRELAFLTAHSMLHIMGYDHIDDTEREIMFAKQESILQNLGIKR